MARALGIDLSKYDLIFEPILATQPIDFVIQRASYAKMKDSKFDDILPGVQQIGIRGAYHYLSSGVHWQEQADFFLKIINGKRFHFYACDFENAYNAVSASFSYVADQWMRYIVAQTGLPVIFYTNPSLYDMYGYLYCSHWPLWLAQYWFFPSSDKNPGMPKRRLAGDWLIWQYDCERNQRPGMSAAYGCGATYIDRDVFNGTVEEMRAWLGLDQASAPAPSSFQPTPMIETRTFQVTIIWGLRVRTSPDASLSTNIVRTMSYREKFQVIDQIEKADFGWLKLTDGNYVARKKYGFPTATYAERIV